MKVLIFFSKGSKCPKLYLFRDRGGGQGVAGGGGGGGGGGGRASSIGSVKMRLQP